MNHDLGIMFAAFHTDDSILKWFVQNDSASLTLLMHTLADCELIAVAVVKLMPLALERVSLRLQANKSVVLAAITADAEAFKFAASSLREDKDFIAKVLTRYIVVKGCLLDWALEPARSDRELVRLQEAALVPHHAVQLSLSREAPSTTS
jgi:hypothetical protein